MIPIINNHDTAIACIAQAMAAKNTKWGLKMKGMNRQQVIEAIMNNSIDGAISEVSGMYYPVDGGELVEIWREYCTNEDHAAFPKLSDFQWEQLRDLPEQVVDRFMDGWVDVQY